MEAVQRWGVDTDQIEHDVNPPRSAALARGTPSEHGARLEHQVSLHLLTEHRVLETELDHAIETRNYPGSGRW